MNYVPPIYSVSKNLNNEEEVPLIDWRFSKREATMKSWKHSLVVLK